MNTLKLNSAGLNRVILNTIGEVRFVSKPPIPTYTLSASVVNGVVSATLNGVAVPLPYTAKEGDVIVVSVTPTDGYTFEGWSDGNTDNPRTITMSEDVDLSAECVEDVPSYENGVYIQHINGKLYTTDEWTAKAFANEVANGVGVVADECSFVMALEIPMGAWGANIDVDDIPYLSYNAAAKIYNGEETSTKILNALEGKIGDNGITGAPLFEACHSYTFPNGAKGYLPTLGECTIIVAKKAEIKSIFSFLGKSISLSYLISSASRSKDKVYSYNNFDSASQTSSYTEISKSYAYAKVFILTPF